MQSETVLLDTADWLEFSPVIWRPTSGDERLAALVGYMTGDGALAVGRQRYARKSGEVSVYERVQGAFYSNIETDLEWVLGDCHMLGMATGASVRPKRGKNPGFQLQIGAADSARLIEAGTPLGKKTTIAFEVPKWIRTGASSTKRAYLAALFGAEGATPVKDKSTKTRFPRQPVLNMCKHAGIDGRTFFDQLRGLLADLGVTASVTETGAAYKTFWLRVGGGVDNLIRFFEEVGFVYCADKALLAWQWAKYLRAYRAEAQRRRSTALQLQTEGESYETIGRHLGLTRGAAHRLLTDIKAGRETTAGHGFPHFAAWLAARWNAKLGLLRLEIAGRSFRAEPVTVWNMLVDSPDHSYLLASGANNFNSFETMSGRVYYAFDRKEHVGEYAFNPQLPIWIGQDFNIDPMSSVIMQPQPNGEVWVVDEVILFGSNTQETADALGQRFYRAFNQIVVYPDPAGNQRGHARGESDLDILREAGFKRLKYRRRHPKIADRINAVNRILRSGDGRIRMRVDSRCRHTIAAFEQTIYKPGTREVDKSQGFEHPADAVGYCIDLEFPVRDVQILGLSL